MKLVIRLFNLAKLKQVQLLCLCEKLADLVHGISDRKLFFCSILILDGNTIRTLVESGKDIESAYWKLVVKDILDACELFEPIYDHTKGADGYVSVEVSPRLDDDTNVTVESAKFLHKVVNRRNVYTKIPATASCILSIRDVIASGISANVIFIFSIARYEAVIDAYLDGLEASGLDDLSRVTSVASVFFSEDHFDRVVEEACSPRGVHSIFVELRTDV